MQGITPRETSFGIWEAHDGEKLSSWLLQQHKDSHTYVHFSLGSTTSSRFQKQENLLKLNKVTTV
jgi:alpha/beta superfamily hydrolase